MNRLNFRLWGIIPGPRMSIDIQTTALPGVFTSGFLLACGGDSFPQPGGGELFPQQLLEERRREQDD